MGSNRVRRRVTKVYLLVEFDKYGRFERIASREEDIQRFARLVPHLDTRGEWPIIHLVGQRSLSELYVWQQEHKGQSTRGSKRGSNGGRKRGSNGGSNEGSKRDRTTSEKS
jgi:hypothetical protein